MRFVIWFGLCCFNALLSVAVSCYYFNLELVFFIVLLLCMLLWVLWGVSFGRRCFGCWGVVCIGLVLGVVLRVGFGVLVIEVWACFSVGLLFRGSFVTDRG